MANKRHIRLESARDARKLLAKIINQRLRDEVDGETCRDVGFLTKILLSAIETSELEDRLVELEALVQQRIQNP